MAVERGCSNILL